MENETNKATFHTVTQREKQAFCHHLNVNLADDSELKQYLPTDEKNIFDVVGDGIILCKMINVAVPGTIPEVAINKQHPLNIFQKAENLNLAISSARSIGCTVVNIHPKSITQKKQHIVLGLIWQIIRIHIFRKINLRSVPELVLLARPDEDPSNLYKLKPEEILIRWFNYHIAKNNQKREIKNLGKDLTDGFAYGHVFSHICQQWRDQYWQLDNKQRSQRIIYFAEKIGLKPYIRAQDIIDGNSILNTLFSTQIFNHRHGLKFPEPEPQAPQPPPPPPIVEVVQADTDESREIKVFKNWINSMGLEDVYLTYLIEGLKDGRVFLKVIQRLRPGIVNWEKFSTKIDKRLFCVQNCNYVVDLCKNNLKIQVHNIGGVDIVDGRVTLDLGLIWQLCKIYWVQRCGDISQQKLLEWANNRVPQQYRIKSLKDKSISNCWFLIKLIQSIDARVVDQKFLDSSNNIGASEANIKYTISSARKLGAQIILLWEHVFESNSKFLYTFLAELHYQANRQNK